MANYYVDTAADAGGNGTTTALTGANCAFKTIAQVVAATFVAGDIVYCRRGRIWREYLTIGESGAAGAPITYQDYGTGDLPAICGADLVGTWSNHSGNIWSAACTTEPKVVLFDGVVGSPQANHDACTAAGHWFWESNVLYIYATSDPDTAYTEPGIEAAKRDWGITTNWGTGRDYITLKNLRVYGVNNGPAIHSSRCSHWTADTVTVEKCARGAYAGRAPYYHTITNCTFTGVREIAAAWVGVYLYKESATYPGGHNTVTGSTINYFSGYGIHFWGDSLHTNPMESVVCTDNDLSHNATGAYFSRINGATVTGNTCDDNFDGPNTTAEEYGLAFGGVSNATVTDNECKYGRCGIELWNHLAIVEEADYTSYGPAYNNTFTRNKLHHNTQHGFLIYEGTSNNTLINRNLIYANGYGGISISEVSSTGIGNIIRHNTLYNNNTTNGGYADIFFGTGCAGWTVKNNVAFAVTAQAFRCTAAAGFAGVHDYNLYWRASGNIIDNHGTYYAAAAIATWEAHGKAADPLFTSVTDGAENFTPLLTPTVSPCKDAGEDLGDNTDYYGNPVT